MPVSDEDQRQIMSTLARGNPEALDQNPPNVPEGQQNLDVRDYQNFDNFAQRSSGDEQPEIGIQPETSPAVETVNLEPTIDQETYTLDKLPSTEPSGPKRWSQFGKELSEQFVLFLENAREAFEKYKSAIIPIGLALAVIPFLVFIVALLTVINAIPLLAPALKLVGFGFTAWFVYRYILFAPNRQEFSEEVEGLKQQIVGKQDSEDPTSSSD